MADELRWVWVGEVFTKWTDSPPDHQAALWNSEPIGGVRIEMTGPKKGQCVWSMSMTAPQIDNRFEINGYELTEADAKAAVAASFEELRARARAAGSRIGEGRWRSPL